MLYLTAESELTSVLSILLFIPQFLLLLVFSVKFYKDPSLCWFLNTFVFVTFNKVCTSQVKDVRNYSLLNFTVTVQ